MRPLLSHCTSTADLPKADISIEQADQQRLGIVRIGTFGEPGAKTLPFPEFDDVNGNAP